MNRSDKDQYMYINKMVFECNEHLLNSNTSNAQETYERVMDAYKLLPNNLKLKVYPHALKLREKINIHRNSPIIYQDHQDFFRLFNGKVIKNLYHLVYVLDSIDDFGLQYHVNAMKNEIHEWIKYKIKDKELAEMIEDIVDRNEIKKIVMRHLLLKNFP